MLFTIFTRLWLDSGIDKHHSNMFDDHGVASLHYFLEIVRAGADFYCRCFLLVPSIALIAAALVCGGDDVQPENALTRVAQGVWPFSDSVTSGAR